MGQTKGITTHHGTHGTDTTHTAHTQTRVHTTWPAGPGSPPRGRAAGEGGRLNPDAPHHPRGAQPPTGHASHGASAGPPHLHTRAHSTWVADPDSTPGGREVGGGGAPYPRRPSQRRKAPCRGTLFRHPHSAQRRPARAHAVGPVQGPHASTNRTRDTRVAESWLPAPEDRRPGEGQRLTPDAPHNGGRPTPWGMAPHHPRGTQPPQGTQARGTVLGPHTRTPAPTARGWRTPTARPEGWQSGEGERPTSEARHNGEKHPPPGMPFRHPHSAQRQPARAHAVGQVLGPHARTIRTRETRVAEPRLPAPEDGQPGEGQRLTPDAPHNGGRPPPRGRPPTTPRHAAPTGHASQGDSAGPAHPHTRGHSTWVADPDSPPGGRAVGGGGAPDLERPSQRRKAPPPGTPFRHPHSAQRRRAGPDAVGQCRVPTPTPAAPGRHGLRNPGCPP